MKTTVCLTITVGASETHQSHTGLLLQGDKHNNTSRISTTNTLDYCKEFLQPYSSMSLQSYLTFVMPNPLLNLELYIRHHSFPNKAGDMLVCTNMYNDKY